MNIIVTCYSPLQVFLAILWPSLALTMLIKSYQPAQLTPSDHLSEMFFLGPLTLWIAYFAWSIALKTPNILSKAIWIISAQSCFWAFIYWAGGTVFHSGYMNEWTNDQIWAFATIDYDHSARTYNPESWSGVVTYFRWLCGINVAVVLLETIFYKGSSEMLICAILQGIGIYQVLIIIAMIFDEPKVLLALHNMISEPTPEIQIGSDTKRNRKKISKIYQKL